MANSVKMENQYNSRHNCKLIKAKMTTVIIHKVETATGHNSMKNVTKPMTAVDSVKTKFQWHSKQARLHPIAGTSESINKSNVCFWMTELFIISLGPLGVYYLFCHITGFDGKLNIFIDLISLASVMSFFNPIIYFTKRKLFQTLLSQTLREQMSYQLGS